MKSEKNFFSIFLFFRTNLYKVQSPRITETNKYKKSITTNKKDRQRNKKKVPFPPTQCAFHNVLLSY